MLNNSVREISDDEMDRLAGGTGKGRPHIDRYCCVDCGACAESCPKGCLFFNDNEITFRGELCNGCGQCEESCPNAAISMY